MKQEIDYSPLGFYRPSLFHLNVATNKPLSDWTIWDDTTLCTFFHEYIHFLQDIMTVFGLQNTFINGEYIAYACNEIYPKGKPASFDVPIVPQPGPQYIYENKVMSRYTTCRLQPNNAIVPNLHPFNVTGKANGSDVDLPMYDKKITYTAIMVPTDHGDLMLGAYHVKEGMAYLAEKIVYGSPIMVLSPDYPYNVIEQLGRFYLDTTDEREYRLLLFGLCSLALQCSHPAKAIVEYMKDAASLQSQMPTSDIIRHLANCAEFIELDGTILSMNDCLDRARNYAFKALDRQFATVDHTSVRTWYHTVINEAVDWIKANPVLLVDLVSFGKLKTNQIFKTFMDRFGTPLLSNASNEIYHYDATKQVNIAHHSRLLAAGSIIATMQGSKGCLLYDYCHQKGVQQCDDSCKTEPWTKAKPAFACPYGHMWQGWNLSGFTPQIP